MKKLFTLLILLGLLPVTALAAGEDVPNVLCVGTTNIGTTSYNDNAAYWTSEDGGTTWNSQQTQPEGDSYIYYDGQGTLELHNVTIQGQYDDSHVFGAGIYALCGTNQSVSLTIQLTGNNTITGDFGIYVEAQQGGTLGANASLSITGDGSLTVTGTASYGLYVKSGTGDASLTIKNASVDAKTTQIYSSYAGVCVQSGASATGSPQLSLAVNGGSLTASASEGNDGIQFYVGNSSASATTSLTVSENAIVDARNGGISASGISETLPTPTPTGNNSSGIVFDGTEGTVYGKVELQEDLKIGEGESLTIGKDASLTVPSGTTLTNNGTVTTTDGGSLTNQGTINNSGTLPDSIEGSQPPKITTASLSDGTVNTAYNQPLAADNNPTSWSVTNGALPNGLTLEKGTISGIPTAAGTSTFTVKAENTAGSDSKELTLTINPAPVLVTSVALNKSELSLYTGQSEILTATVQPEDATNKNVTWSSDNADVATVDNGTVTAVSAGTATITVTTADGNYTATCTVKVTDPVYDMTTDTTALNFGSAYTGYTQPAAQTVTITNTGNRPQTLVQPASTNSFIVGNLSTTELAVGETATFTVQPKADLPVGTYSEDITVSSSEGATLSITASFNVRKEVKVEPSGSTNLSFTTDRDEFTLTAIVYGENLSQEPNCWEWTVEDKDVVERVTLRSKAVSYSTSRQAFTIKGPGTTTITATYDDGKYHGSVIFSVSISKPTTPDPQPAIYNIYVEDVCDGVEVSTSKQAVKEGGSIIVYVEKDTAHYTFDNFHVYYKEGYYGPWVELPEGVQPGEYPIKNIWNHIYIKAEGAEEKEDPTGIEQIEGVKVYTKDGSLYVQTPQREQVIIVSMSGAVVKNEEQIGLKQYHGLQPGIYIVRVGDRAYKLRLH